MKKQFLAGILAVGCGLANAQATVPKYENYGTVSSPLNIDATIFINGGLFDISGFGGTNDSYYYYFFGGSQPFTTQNTILYTNLASGTMRSDAGFQLYYLNLGYPRKAGTIENRGTIEGQLIDVFATNILSSGLLLADGGGLIRLEGDHVSLRRNGMRATGYSSGSIFGGAEGAYTGVEAEYYGAGTNNVIGDRRQTTMDLALLSMPQPQSPMHDVLEAVSGTSTNLYFTNMVTVPMFPGFGGFAAYAQTNLFNDTNPVIQVIFLSTNLFDTNVLFRAGFIRTMGDEPGDVAVVEWRSVAYDVVTGQPYTNYITFYDYAATQTNVILATNMFGDFTRPDCYSILQGTRPRIFGNLTNNTEFDNTLILNPGYTNTVVSNVYAGYSAQVGVKSISTAYTPQNPSLTDPTNEPGRIEITAKQLDLNRTRMRASSVVSLKTPNLLSTEGLQLDAPIVRLDLSTTNGVLEVGTNLLPHSVKRLYGDLQAWSGLWTNLTGVVATNETDGSLTTNTIEIKFHALILDHQMYSDREVDSYSINLRDSNIVLNADCNVSKSFIIDTPNLTIRSNLLGAALQNFVSTNLPTIQSFTNLGTISIGNLANFGNDRPAPFLNLVNRGTVTANGIRMRARALDHSGLLEAVSGAVELTAIAAKLDDGTIEATANVEIAAEELKVRNTRIGASAILLNVTNRLADGGPGSGSVWECQDGIHLLRKPVAGDLLGTEVASSAPQFVEVFHRWAGVDRGATADGFVDNAALGRLRLIGAPQSLFTFQPAGASNALYVDYLQFEEHATNFLDALEISPNMKVYFAASSIPADELDGLFNGRLRWVRSYVGANSTAEVPLSGGGTIQVNAGLASSQKIDSDADGQVNAVDPFPFDGVVITDVAVAELPALTTLISWQAAADTTYQVDYTMDFANPQWQILTTYHHDAAANGPAVVRDTLPPGTTQRYYRISYRPGQ